jgi:hypothetical protein
VIEGPRTAGFGTAGCRTAGFSRHRVVVAVALLLAACSAFRQPLAREVQGQSAFRLVADDGCTAVWSVRPLDAAEGRAWMVLASGERRRVEDFFGTVVPGRVSLWLVDELPRRFGGDAFSEGKDVYLRMGANRLPLAADAGLVAHEMAHVVLHESFGMERPFWFEEGIATYVEGTRLGYGAGARDMLSGVDGLARLESSRLTLGGVAAVGPPLSYRLSAAANELIVERHGAGALRRLQRQPSGRPFADGYFRVTGETLGGLEARWRDEIRAVARLRATTP